MEKINTYCDCPDVEVYDEVTHRWLPTEFESLEEIQKMYKETYNMNGVILSRHLYITSSTYCKLYRLAKKKWISCPGWTRYSYY